MKRIALLFCVLLAAGCSSSKPADTTPPAAEAPAPKPIPAGPKLFVTNESGGDISVIDVGTQQLVATIPVGKRPRGIRLSPDGSTIYVALSGSPIAGPGVDESKLPPPDKKADGIGVVSVKEMKFIRLIPAGSDPEQMAITLDGTRLFAANEDTGLATALEIETGKVLGSWKVGDEPEGVNMRPDGHVVYVTSEGDNQVSAIDVDKLKLLKTFEVGARPRSTAFTPDSSRAYVPSETGQAITVIDAKQHKVLTTIKLEGGPLVRPMGTVVSPDGTTLYATTGRGKSVLYIDTKTNKQTATFEVGERPWGITVSPDGKFLFTANGPSNDVSIIDVAEKKVVAKVKAGNRPWGIAYVP